MMPEIAPRHTNLCVRQGETPSSPGRLLTIFIRRVSSAFLWVDFDKRAIFLIQAVYELSRTTARISDYGTRARSAGRVIPLDREAVPRCKDERDRLPGSSPGFGKCHGISRELLRIVRSRIGKDRRRSDPSDRPSHRISPIRKLDSNPFDYGIDKRESIGLTCPDLVESL